MQIARTDEEIMACFEVMQQLRPQLQKEQFIETVHGMETEGYVLAFLSSEDKVVAVAGYYLCNKLSVNGRSLYVYDLVSDEHHRSRGFGKQLIDELKDLARRENCVTIELDSGVQRFDAHRFYLREGFHISSHHFACVLK